MTTAPPVQENLWLKAIRSYWSDPRNLIGPPGALVRRLFKFSWFLLAIYILIWVAAPLQIASWKLWMTDDNLAVRVGWTFVLASALAFAVVRYAAEQTEPIKMPIFLPTLKGWRDWRTAHLHLPVPTVLIGGVMVAALYAISLLGLWNLYLHEQQTTGGASVAAISGSTDRVAEAEAALRAHSAATGVALAGIDQAIRDTPPGSPTGRSRLVRQRTELMTSAAATEQQLRAELRQARSETVSTQQQFSDPRPVDAQVAGVTGVPRPIMASLLDLMRSATIEMLLVMGAGLSLVGATSRIGASETASRETLKNTEETIVAETAAAPEDTPLPEPKRRFTLPAATAEDVARAAAIGPIARVAEEPAAPVEQPPLESAPPVSEDAPIEDEEAQEQPVELDPLVAARLQAEEVENA